MSRLLPRQNIGLKKGRILMLEAKEIVRIAVIEGTFRKYPTLENVIRATYPETEIVEVDCMESFVRENAKNDKNWAFVTEKRLFPIDLFSTIKFLDEKLGEKISKVVLIRPAIIEGIGFDDEVSHFTEMRMLRTFGNFSLMSEDRVSGFRIEQKVSEK